MKRKTIRQGGINVHAMAKRILGLGMIHENSLTDQNKRDIWAIEACFKKNQPSHGGGNKPHGYCNGRGMEFIADFVMSH